MRLEQAEERLFDRMFEKRRVVLLVEWKGAEFGGREDVCACDLGHLLLAGDDDEKLGAMQLDDANDTVYRHGLVAACWSILGEAETAVISVDHEGLGGGSARCRSRFEDVGLRRNAHSEPIPQLGKAA